MKNHDQPMQSGKTMNIQTRVCPCGSVYLYVGQTCVYLRQEEFLDLAQLVQATERHLLEQQDPLIDELRH